MKNRAVIFDRDGTLIVDKIYLNDPDEIVYLPGVFEALRRIRDAGFLFFVATNQSGVPRGLVQLQNLWKIHETIQGDFAREGVEILKFYYAPFPTDSNHPMRKPNPGMLLQAAEEYNLDLTCSWMVGDRVTDLQAGFAAGTRSILLPHGDHHETIEEKSLLGSKYFTCNILGEVADLILTHA